MAAERVHCRTMALCVRPIRCELDPGEAGRQPRAKVRGPRFGLTADAAVQEQLEALRNNDTPTPDAGIELLYQFTIFDPFVRSQYFGRPLDLGQFERFRRVMHQKPYRILLRHRSTKLVAAASLSENLYVQRMAIEGIRGDSVVVTFRLQRALGGVHDGIWKTASLIADDISGLRTLSY